MTTELTVADITIKSDAEGRYCLNDLYKASGGKEKDAPNRFTRSDQFAGMVAELERQNPTFKPVKVVRGRGITGTYVCVELVYSYAMWINPKFHLKIIKLFGRLQTQGVALADHAADDLLINPLVYYEKLLVQAQQLQVERDLAIQRETNVRAVAAPRAVTTTASLADLR